MAAAPRLAPVLLAAWLAACAGAAGPIPPGAEGQVLPGPARGDPVAEVLAALGSPPGLRARVSVEEVRLVRREGLRWEELSRREAAAARGAVGVIARRRCQLREGLSVVRESRTSWYAFEDGRLEAFDHAAFDPGCRVLRQFAPAAGEATLETERTLVRFAAQRHADAALDAAERLRRGLALVAAERLDEARADLRAGDLALEALGYQRERARAEEHEALELRERELRALRARLHHALVQAKSEGSAVAEPQRSGR
jgi:hypothetical protein